MAFETFGDYMSIGDAQLARRRQQLARLSPEQLGAWSNFNSIGDDDAETAEEVMGALEIFDPESEEIAGFSLRKAVRKATRPVKKVVKKVKRAPKKIAKAVKKAPHDVVHYAKKPKSAVKAVKRAVRKVRRKAHPIVRTGVRVTGNKYVQATATGIALAYPPASGLPAALATANKAFKVADGVIGNPKQQKAMKKAIANTVRAGKAGNVAAARMTKALAVVAKRKRAAVGRPATSGILVLPGGKIRRGKWRSLN